MSSWSELFRNGCTVIGEVAQAHDGSLGMAHAYIDAIADAGADAVKFQTHIASAESTPAEPWRVKFSLQDATRYDYWKRMEFTDEQWAGLKEHAEKRGLLFLSSPFSHEAADLLERIGIKAWKIASGEITNTPLLKRLAASGLPMMYSSGMSTLEVLDSAISIAKESASPFAVLQCTTEYPCPPEKIGLNLLHLFSERYQCPVGLSDHSGKIFSGLAAAVLGASIVEVHVTLSRQMFGPDVVASVTTEELRQLVDGVRHIERMLASPVTKDTLVAELNGTRETFSKSIVAKRDIALGEVITELDIAFKKPGTGIPAAEYATVIGRRARKNIKADHMIFHADLEGID